MEVNKSLQLLHKRKKFQLISLHRNLTIHSKLYGNCTFPQNFHTRKLGEITVIYAVNAILAPALMTYQLLNCIHLVNNNSGEKLNYPYT